MVAAGVVAAVAGCGTPEYAIVNGVRLHRPSLSYGNGSDFRLIHARAFPGIFDPGRGHDVDDGTLIGHVCGVDVRFDASWYGSHLLLQGTGDVPYIREFTHTEGLMKLDLEITEVAPGHRIIQGRGAGMDIHLDVSDERLTGNIGPRQFTLAADGDYLIGRIVRHVDLERPIDEPYVIYGRQQLATMVPADEALILVMMLGCNGPSLTMPDGNHARGFSLVPLGANSG